MKPEYCDYIASQVRSVVNTDPERLIKKVGAVAMDLHPTEGYLQSTKKVIEVTDAFGKKYRVTVEAVDS